MIPSMLYIILKVKNNRSRIKLIMPHVNSVCQLSKYTVLLQRHNEIRQLLNDLKREWLNATKEDQWIYTTRASIGHRLMMPFVILLYTGGTSLRAIIPLLRGKIVLPNNTTMRLLPCPGYFVFFNEQLTPNYEIIFVMQVLCGFVNYTTLCGTLALCSMFCLHMCSMMRILANKMIQLSNQPDTDENAVQEKITDIVEYHTKIKRFLHRAEHVTSSMYFVEISNEVVISCVLGYCIIMEWESNSLTGIITYFMLQATTTVGTFTNCYIGQLLIDESDIVKKASHTFNWYRFPLKKARNLIMIIITSNYPMKVTAAKIVEMSLATFTDYTIVLRRHKEIRELMEDLRNDWLSGTEEDQRIYKTRATIGQRLIMLIMIFLYTGGMSFRAIIPFLRGKIVLPDNTTLRPLPCPGYFILFNEQLTPNYEIIFFIQVFSGFLSYTEVSAALGLCATLCLHMCSMLKILGNKMRELSSLSEKDEDTVQKKITDIVEYQTKIKIYFNRSEYVTSFIYFVELTGEVIIMCVIGYSMIMEWENSNIAGLFPYFALQVACVIDVFTICYIGQLLIDEGNIVKKISNTFDWYQLPVKKARSLIMVIIMSNNPMSVTAANVTQLSLITFTDEWENSNTAGLFTYFALQVASVIDLYTNCYVGQLLIDELCKYTIFLWRHNEIRELLDDLKNDWLNAAEDDQWIYKSRATIGHRLMMLIIIFLFTGGGLFLTIIPFLREKVVLPDNTTIRPLPSPSYFVFFNDQVSPNYEIIFFIQVFCGFISYTTYTGALGLCTTLCLHMCSMLKILGNKMRELSNLSGTDEDTVQNEIANIIVYQTKIRNLLLNTEWESSNTTALVTYVALELTTIIGMFTNCFVGQLLIDEGNIVKKISNTLDWHQLPVKKARCLILIIITSNIPMTITVANIVQLSLITFIDILKHHKIFEGLGKVETMESL
ncbi:Odorant receptor 43a [Melipona quadrifasciata]|uniref:Odorant receptor 43a n=1 Tax=Melipona quadrifasciata TaxID=166423 RepID=A0A0M9A123_9HYME|nr:Odorant receptor 43a [Melipona quadrifasciata]